MSPRERRERRGSAEPAGIVVQDARIAQRKRALSLDWLMTFLDAEKEAVKGLPWRARQALSGQAVDPQVQAGSERLMYKYEIILYWSNEDGAFVVEAPELLGCMAHGADQESALANIKDAMRFWIERARALGRPVPEAKGERLMLA